MPARLRWPQPWLLPSRKTPTTRSLAGALTSKAWLGIEPTPWPGDPAMALLSANLARRGKVGPLLWANERVLPAPVNDYLWSQRAAFWVTPSEGPFHHFWILGDTAQISSPAQGQADYAVEIGPYKEKGPGASGMDMLVIAWVALASLCQGGPVV